MRSSVSLVLVALLASAVLIGQAADVPLSNWTVPPYTRASTGGMTTMTDVTSPTPFIGVQPCRVADTRGNGAPIQGGIFGNSEARDWTVSGICGIPSGAAAISVNFTVVSAPATPQGGFLLAWPTGSPPPPGNPTAIMTYGPGVTILSNAAIVPLSDTGSLTVNVSHSTHVVMDVNGYFSYAPANAATSFYVQTNSGGATGLFVNQSTACSINGCALRGYAYTAGSGKAVAGEVPFGGTNSAGVMGVHGSSGAATAYVGAGVRGQGPNGVLGISGGIAVLDSYAGAGVRGDGGNYGVLGVSPLQGVAGSVLSMGHEVAWGILGFSTGTSIGGGSPPWGVFSGGRIGATATKYFLDPHPTDPSRAIGYVSLEGPEAGTYFRGRARFQNGIARIPVPEHFRLVTDPEALTVQITPIGAMATVAILKMDLNEIVAQGSRNVEFCYLVQGVRATFKDESPLRGSDEFMPRSADAKIPEWLSPAQRKLLIQNGTYREDGTVNIETARRLGWDRVWSERAGTPSPAPTP